MVGRSQSVDRVWVYPRLIAAARHWKKLNLGESWQLLVESASDGACQTTDATKAYDS